MKKGWFTKMADNYLGESIKKLGFGLMRLPMKGDVIDIEQTKKMADTFLSKGFTYFDTAWVYIGGTSEVALKEAVVDRYPRDSFQCASKLPLWVCDKPEDMRRVAQESLDRAGLSYYDFYLLHAMNKERFDLADKLGAWKFMEQWKAEGKAKHIGLSFHDTADVLDEALTNHPEMEFVQLQINYKDWEDEGVQSRKCYEVARKHNKPVIIMEPVKGGALATMPPEVQDLFRSANPELSVPSWAVRYAASLEGVVTVLSGMSDEAQLNDNVSYMEHFEPLSDGERGTIQKAVKILDSLPTIPCTKCKYCVDGCPQKINIPEIFAAMNDFTLYNNEAGAKRSYGNAVKDCGKASDCIQCGACEGQCPQHIEIIECLKKAAAALE